jgi:hypothetical protein
MESWRVLDTPMCPYEPKYLAKAFSTSIGHA